MVMHYENCVLLGSEKILVLASHHEKFNSLGWAINHLGKVLDNYIADTL